MRKHKIKVRLSKCLLRIQIALIFVCLFISKSYAQNSDFGIWYGINAEYSFNKKLEADLSGMIRTFNSAAEIDQSFLEGGLTYKINKIFSASGSYRLTYNIENIAGYYPQHKIFADFKATLPAGNFSFSSRLRTQYQKKIYIEKLSDKLPDYTFRLKLKAEYKSTSSPINPYFYFESFSPIDGKSDLFIDKYRLASGLVCKLTPKQSVEVEYIYQRSRESQISNLNVISVSYNLKFK